MFAKNPVPVLPAPTVELSTTNAEVDAAFEVYVLFSTNVDGLEVSDFNLFNGNIIGMTGSEQDYTLLVEPITGGAIKINLPANSVVDDLGEGNLASNLLEVQFLDSDSPTPILETDSEIVEGEFEVTVTFNEPVYGMEISDFNISNGAIINLSGGPSIFTLVVSPGAEGGIAIFMPPDRVVDVAGNHNVISNFLQLNFSLEDNIAPASSLSTFSTEVYGSFITNIQFNEPVTGLELEDLVIENATATDLLGVGMGYTILVTPLNEGNIMLYLPENSAVDEAGNGNIASNELNVNFELLDNIPPSVQITSSETTVEGAFELTVQFSEPIEGLDIGDFLIQNGIITSIEGFDQSFIITIEPELAGDILITLPANQVTDLSGNGNLSSDQLSVYYVGNITEFFLLELQKEDGHIVVSWTTNTSYKNKMFVVEHSADSINFLPVFEQLSESNSTNTIQYQFLDYTPETGANYYRIKLIYNDESHIYSETKRIDFNIEMDDFIVFPSPAKEFVYLNLSRYAGVRCEIIIFNFLGQWLYHETFGALPDTPIQVDLSTFNNGLHSVHLRIKEVDKFTKTFMVIEEY